MASTKKRIRKKPAPKRKRTPTSRTTKTRRRTTRRKKAPKKAARPMRARRSHARQAKATAARRARRRGTALAGRPVARALPVAAGAITQTFVDAALAVRFSNAASIDQYYVDRFKQPFLDWYHRTVDATQPKDAEVKKRFAAFWDSFTGILGGTVWLLQQVTLHEVFRKEGNGDMRPRGEKVGTAGHRGIAYLFDKVPGIKRSYNTGPGNLTAGRLFNDAEFLAAHGNLPLGNQLAHTQDAAWKGDVYPQTTTPTDDDPAVTGFVLEADFSKFRGRGLIQTTFRSNYAKLIAWVQAYQGTKPVIREFQDAWKGATADSVATRSRLADWRRLFEESDFEIPAHAIRLHNASSGRYLDLGETASVVNGPGAGSIFNVGKRINGGDGYGHDLAARVVKVCNALGN